MKIKHKDTTSYTTKDGSQIRELIHPDKLDAKHQSLAEACVMPQQKTSAHYHKKTEEIYFILSGTGEMFLDEQRFAVATGDSILIKPGQIHCIENTGNTELRFLCCCAPAYQHNDTFLVETKD